MTCARAPNSTGPTLDLSGLLEDYAHYARGEASAVLPTVKEVTGREARDVATFARDNAAVFGRGTPSD